MKSEYELRAKKIGTNTKNSKMSIAGDQDKWNAAGKDVVVLHMFKRALYAPNISMYPMKLETWLRMKGIK